MNFLLKDVFVKTKSPVSLTNNFWQVLRSKLESAQHSTFQAFKCFITVVNVRPCFSIQLSNFLNAIYRQLACIFRQIARFTHDYYSTWFNLIDDFFISEKKSGVVKLKTHYFISYHFMKC
jgi:hypothetical protein